jgi:hypothetical protein
LFADFVYFQLSALNIRLLHPLRILESARPRRLATASNIRSRLIEVISIPALPTFTPE